jgi:hypothetical protein
VIAGLIAQGVAEGYFRAVDPQLTIRSIIGPMMLHVVLAEVFALGTDISMEQLIDNHITILFDGLSLSPASL